LKPTRKAPSDNEAMTAPMAVVGAEIERAPDDVPVAAGKLPLFDPLLPAEPDGLPDDLPVAVALGAALVLAAPKSWAVLKVVQLDDAGMEGCHGRVLPGVSDAGCFHVVVWPSVPTY